ncbi:hypothetical protein D1007_17453 [Hordeum vulgare]|nr:hypothetical protein D1007_17453 [Hordeum vulgare]
MSGFLRRPLVVCAVVCAAACSGLPHLGTPGSSPSLSSTPADANCVSVSLSMLSAATMRSGVGAGVVLVFSPASRAHCWPAHVENGTMMNSTQEKEMMHMTPFYKELKTNLTLRYLLMTCVHWMNGHPMLAATARNYRMIEEKARATTSFQQRNSELNHQVNDLQDQLQAERANTQEIINLERAEREQLEGKLKEERAERERLLEAERTSRLKFEKNMMAKFAVFSKQMGTQQVFTNRIDKENSNPNFQKTLLQRPSPNKAAGARPSVISSNALIHASTRNSRMFKAIDPNN